MYDIINSVFENHSVYTNKLTINLIHHTILSKFNVGIVKILCRSKVMAFSIKCPLFCSHGKLVPFFLSMVSYLIAMAQYEQKITGEYYGF